MLVDLPNYDDTKLKISWRHSPQDGNGITTCTLDQLKDGESVDKIEAKAVCSVKDQYNKETGRKVSLTRALTLKPWPREERAKIWEAYFARKQKSPLAE